MRRLLPTLAVIGLVLAGCGDDDAESSDVPPVTEPENDIAPSTETEQAEPAVVASQFTFQPRSIEVSPGDTVTFSNEDGVEHTVTAGVPDEPAGDFAESLSAGGTAEVSLDDAGTYPYFCQIHTTMTGEIVVR